MPSPVGRAAAALAVSGLAHAGLVFALLGHEPPATAAVQARVLPVSLVSLPGRGDGGEPAGPPEPPQGPPAPIRAVARPPTRRPLALAARAPRPQPAPPASDQGDPGAAPTPAAPAAGTGGAGGPGGTGGAGSGNGSGGDALAGYGTNPKPPYPLAARRLGLEGVVQLEVLVRADGRAGDVRVRSSSGHDLLDQSAVSTVLNRWRFVPAHRGDVSVESRVVFSIRFQLSDS
jgi:protein TonB